jgi:hypothetical protein
MSSLSENRRWVNLSDIEQRVLDARTGSYVSVKPEEYVEGGQWEREMRGLPYFQETVKHLNQRTFGKLIQEETNISLLNHMLKIELATEKRQTIQTFIETRIKALNKQTSSTAA